MAETVDLRALIRLIPPARALKNDLEESIHTELYAGTGDLAVKSYNNLHTNLTRYIDDPYIESLALKAPENANDREKVLLARMAASQLVAYLEGQIGLVGEGTSKSGNHYYNAPVINGPISSVSDETIENLLGLTANSSTEEEKTERGENERT